MLRADPLNQTVRLHLSNIHGLDKIVEISFLALKSLDDKDRITQDMVSLYDLAGRTNKITCYVNTAERYASWITVSSPGRELAEEQPDLIVSLVVWGGEAYYAALNNQSLRDAAKSILSNTSAFSRYTGKLQLFAPGSISTTTLPRSHFKVRSTADLVSMQPFRRGCFSRGKGKDPHAHLQRMAEPMYRNEESSQWSLSRHQCPRPLILDIFQIKYTTGSNLMKQFMFPNDLADQVDKLRNEMKSYSRCRAVLIARICSLEDESGNYEDAGYSTFLSNVFQLFVCE